MVKGQWAKKLGDEESRKLSSAPAFSHSSLRHDRQMSIDEWRTLLMAVGFRALTVWV